LAHRLGLPDHTRPSTSPDRFSGRSLGMFLLIKMGRPTFEGINFPVISRNPQGGVIDSRAPLQYKPCGGAPLTKPKGVAISRREIVRRINCSLKQDDPFHQLRRSRSARAQLDFGDYYVVDLIRDFVVHRDVALEEEARKRRVLADFEYLAN
jgi:hypothetical protein